MSGKQRNVKDDFYCNLAQNQRAPGVAEDLPNFLGVEEDLLAPAPVVKTP